MKKITDPVAEPLPEVESAIPADGTPFEPPPDAADRAGFDQRFAEAYSELRRRAARLFTFEREDHTLTPTAVVNETYVRLSDQPHAGWNGRTHFLAVASQVMRHILVDHARAKGAAKRGGERARVAFDSMAAVPMAFDVLDLDEAIERLRARNEDCARLIELRLYAGATIEEAAKILGCSPAKCGRDWRFARAALIHELRGTTHVGHG